MKNPYPPIIIGLVAVLVFVFSLLVMDRAEDYQGAVNTVESTQQSEKQFRWRMVTTWPKNFPGVGMGAENFAEAVNKLSDGRLQVQVYGAGEIVPAFGVFGAVSAGTVEMGHSSAYYWKGKIPAAPFFTTIPFGMNAQEMNAWLYEGEGMTLWREMYAPFNLIPFPAGNTGVQMAGWFNKEINSLEDIQGLNMRIPGLGGEVFSRAGGTPVNIPGAELYTALQTGRIDATEWVGPYNDLTFGFHQIAKYYYYPGWHEPGSTMEVIVNKDAYNQLPGDLKTIVQQAARSANQMMLDEYTAANNRALKELVNVHKVELRRLPDDVIDRLKEIAFTMYDELAAEDEDFARVYKSYRSFKDSMQDYHKISEQAYYELRE